MAFVCQSAPVREVSLLFCDVDDSPRLPGGEALQGQHHLLLPWPYAAAVELPVDLVLIILGDHLIFVSFNSLEDRRPSGVLAPEVSGECGPPLHPLGDVSAVALGFGDIFAVQAVLGRAP